MNTAPLIVFRTDASLQIGTGHLMRCMTLATGLVSRGARCMFVCRGHPGSLVELIRSNGFELAILPACASIPTPQSDREPLMEAPVHAKWLGSDWYTDAEQTRVVIGNLRPDWLILDHYALDARWAGQLREHCGKLMVIDDLADRRHDCDLLLDQNLGRDPKDYADLVPSHCNVLTGPHYALLRPEFAALRSYSLRRRAMSGLKRVLITMGGVDQPNATGEVLKVLQGCTLPRDCVISVVMGVKAPWLTQVRDMAAEMRWPTEVVVNINDMAARMADSDIAIGAGGGTSWERCCLGLPTLVVVLAANQLAGAEALQEKGAALLIGDRDSIATRLPAALIRVTNEDRLGKMSSAAGIVTAGEGVEMVLDRMGF